MREALRILATRSLIHTRKGMAGGHFIVHPSVEGLTDFLVAHYGLLTALNTVTLENLLEAREALEAPAAELAALRRDDEDMRRLRASVPEDIGEMSTAQAFEHNRDFHYHVLAATKNPLMVVAGRPIYLVLQASAVRRQPTSEVVRMIAEQHTEITDAIEAGDGPLARRRMEDHLAYLRSTTSPATRPTWPRPRASTCCPTAAASARDGRRRAPARCGGCGWWTPRRSSPGRCSRRCSATTAPR